MRFVERRVVQWFFIGLFAGLAAWAFGPIGSRAADDKKGAAATADDPAESSKERPLKPADIPPETFNVPQTADARELLRFIHRVNELRPQFDSEAAAEKFITRSRMAILAAADKLLAGKPAPEQEVEVLKAKLEAYGDLLVVGVPDALPKALKLAETLKSDKRPILAELGQAAWFDFKMGAIPTSDPKERRAFVTELAGALRKRPQTYFQFAMQVGRMLEMLDDGETAAAAYEAFGQILSTNLDEQIRALGEKLKTGAARRAKLLTGDPVKLEGTTLEGKPFSLNEYKGKVVLVDFWATWCGPCLEELPNVRAVYDKYHDRGFEVVGVNLDEEKVALAKFLKEKENNFPWKTLHSAEPGKAGFANPTADYYGISAIPTLFLINREGKVVSLAPRGERLEELVSKLIAKPGDAAGAKVAPATP